MMRKNDPKMTVRHPNFLGAMLAVWNDRVGNGISEQDVHLRTFPGLQVACEKMWKGENADKVHFDNSWRFVRLLLRRRGKTCWPR